MECQIRSFVLQNNTPKSFFDVLLTVQLSIFNSVINQLDAQILFYNKFISCLYMFRAHVLIIRSSKLHYTASGITTPIGVMILTVKQKFCASSWLITEINFQIMFCWGLKWVQLLIAFTTVINLIYT